MSSAFNSSISARLLRGLAVLALTALGTWLLVRLAPGYGLDERLTDVTLGAETRSRIGAQALAAARDWKTSSAFGEPVWDLIGRRAKPTLVAVAAGLAGAWFAALAAVVLNFSVRLRGAWLLADTLVALLVATPVAIFGLAAFVYRLPVAVVIAAAVFPMVYRFLRTRLQTAQSQWSSLGAEARGLSRYRVALVYVLAPARAESAMLAAVSLKWALSAAIPAEVFADSPGLGQLVWKAAEARDLALMVPLTLLVATVVQTAQCAASLVAVRRSA